jgi:hypothetical protein
MKRKIRKIILSLLILGLFAVIAQAQIKTIKGNYCGSTYGSGAGTFGFRVGASQKVVFFDVGFSTSTKLVRFNLQKLKVGDEFIIKYSQGVTVAKAVIGTGKRKLTEPCNLDE